MVFLKSFAEEEDAGHTFDKRTSGRWLLFSSCVGCVCITLQVHWNKSSICSSLFSFIPFELIKHTFNFNYFVKIKFTQFVGMFHVTFCMNLIWMRLLLLFEKACIRCFTQLTYNYYFFIIIINVSSKIFSS